MNVTVATAPEIASGNSVAGWTLSPFCVSMVCLRSQFWSHHALDRPPNLAAQRRGRCPPPPRISAYGRTRTLKISPAVSGADLFARLPPDWYPAKTGQGQEEMARRT